MDIASEERALTNGASGSDASRNDPFDRAAMESAFREYFLTGPVREDWAAWSRLFTADATYHDHYWGTFHGPQEIQDFLEGTMSVASHVYSPLVWYVIDGPRIVYKVVNRADNPEPGAEPIEFASLQVIERDATGTGWRSEDDWWVAAEMKAFTARYDDAVARHGTPAPGVLSRADWGPWVDWARPGPGEQPAPSWLGRTDVPHLWKRKDATFGVRPAHG
ncbi:MAG TPA: nuclear transport factor 2 family protein [Mycobacteriales bacterium]|nr:nuclear transport factor 2 family protein [Mycobacteriales bacterium]